MFDFLADLGFEIQARYKTVVRDIKSKSNSFYDAYLDLQEASIKSIIDANGITYDESRTCGYLLRNEDVMNLFLNTLRVPEDAYSQIRDRTSKVNRHKHHKEKHILPDSVVAFMETYHRFMKSWCGSNEEFDGEYFRGIFGEFERVNQTLRREKDAIIAEFSDLEKEKRMTEDQLRLYQEALAMSQVSEEGLAEQNDALLKEISALKSLKLSILDQKLNKTIDLLNNLQDYVTENRAVSMAVGYTVVGKERIGSYIDMARSEMGRPEKPEITPKENQNMEMDSKPSFGVPMIKGHGDKEAVPYSVLDATTRTSVPEPETLTTRIGENPEPYLFSKNITVKPGERDIAAKKTGIAVRVVGIFFGVLVIILWLFQNNWLKLLTAIPITITAFMVLETICYLKNLKEISNTNPWIRKKAEIQADLNKKTTKVTFIGSAGGRWSRIGNSKAFFMLIYPEFFCSIFLAMFEIVFQSSEGSTWATLLSATTIAASLLPAMVQLILFAKKPAFNHGRYVCMKAGNKVLTCDMEQFGLDAWCLEAKD